MGSGILGDGDNTWTLDDALDLLEQEIASKQPELELASGKANNKYKKVCYHDWKYYEGFTDIYYFCKKCDLKRKEKP